MAGRTDPAFGLAPENPRGLKVRELVFVDRYLVHFNATRAYQEAGYRPGRHNAARLLKKPRVQRELQARLAPVMLGEEALARLSINARFDIRKLFPDDKTLAELP